MQIKFPEIFRGVAAGAFTLGWPLDSVAQSTPAMATPAIGSSTARAEAGIVAARGNSDNESANVKFEATREWIRWKQAFGGAAVYAADATGATGQRWNVRGQTDYRFHRQGFSFAGARYEQDRFGGFEYQASLSMGLGWRFFDDPVTKLSAQLGVGYRRLHTSDSLADDGVTPVAGGREEAFVEQANVDFERVLTHNTQLLDKLLVEAGSENTFIQNDISVQVKIMAQLALAVGYSVRYNTNPPSGFNTTDTLSTLNLVYEFK